MFAAVRHFHPCLIFGGTTRCLFWVYSPKRGSIQVGSFLALSSYGYGGGEAKVTGTLAYYDKELITAVKKFYSNCLLCQSCGIDGQKKRI